MEPVSDLDEERLGALLAVLRPAPPGWVKAAEALPATLADLEDVLGRLGQDDDFQAQFARDPHAALRHAGLPTTPDVVAAVRVSTGDHGSK